MAEVAFFFHWPPSAMETMPVDELTDWRDRAIAIHNKLNTPEK